jgi:hypothetical protein
MAITVVLGAGNRKMADGMTEKKVGFEFRRHTSSLRTQWMSAARAPCSGSTDMIRITVNVRVRTSCYLACLFLPGFLEEYKSS